MALRLVAQRSARLLRGHTSSTSVPRRLFSHPQVQQSTRQSQTPSYSNVHRQSSRWRYQPQNAFTSPIPNAKASAKRTGIPFSTEIPRLHLSYHDLERALERAGLTTTRTLLTAGAVLLLTLGLAWPRIKRWGAVEGAEVAAASLEQQQLQEKASAMVHEVLSDPKTGQRVEGLLKDSIKSLFADEEFTAQAVEWSARVLAEALTWENVQQKGVDYVIAVLDNDVSKETVRQYLAEAISNVVQDEKTQDDVATGIWSGVRASVLGRRWTKQQQASVPEVAVTEAVDAASASEDRGIRGASMKIGTESEKT